MKNKTMHLFRTKASDADSGGTHQRRNDSRQTLAEFARSWRHNGSRIIPTRPGIAWYEIENGDRTNRREWIWWLTTQKEAFWP